MGEDPREQSEAAFRPTVVMRSQSANKSLINRRDCRCPDLQTEITRAKIGAGIRVSGTLTPVIRNHRSTLTPTEFVTRWENNWSEVSTRTAGPAELAGALQSVSSSVEESTSYIRRMNPEIHYPGGPNLGCSSEGGSVLLHHTGSLDLS